MELFFWCLSKNRIMQRNKRNSTPKLNGACFLLRRLLILCLLYTSDAADDC